MIKNNRTKQFLRFLLFAALAAAFMLLACAASADTAGTSEPLILSNDASASADAADTEKTVSTVAISGYPSKGALPSESLLSCSTEGVTLKNVLWLADGESLPSTASFGNGVYNAVITLSAGDGYVFSKDVSATAFGLKCTSGGISLDGKTAVFVTDYVDMSCTHNWVMTSDSTAYSETGTKEYLCVKCQSKKSVDKAGSVTITYGYQSTVEGLVSVIEITDVTEPRCGKAVNLKAVSGNCKIKSICFSTPDKFECGTAYTVIVEVQPSGTDRFSSLTKATVNGYTAECGILSPTSASVSFTFAPTGHSFGDWTVESAATCLEAGLRTRKCSLCNETESEEIPVTEHVIINYQGIAADCLHTGNNPYSKCENCGTVFDENGNPSDISAYTLAVDPDNHVSANDPIIVNSGSATIHLLTCKCGDTIDKEAHSFGDYHDTDNRTRTRQCTRCGYTETETVKPDRDYTKIIIVAAVAALAVASAAVLIALSRKNRH